MLRPDGTVAIIADAKGTILEWPSDLEGVLGYSVTEAVGQKVDLIVPPALRGRHWNGFNKAIAADRLKRDGKSTTAVALHKSGKLVPLRATLELTHSAGAVTGAKATILGRGPGWLAPAARILLALPGVRKPRPGPN